MSTKDQPDWWKNVGGENSQDSILERRSLIWNDDNIEDGAVPGAFYDAIIYKGKFFTRGCRGMLEQLQLYCLGDGVDEITLRYSPHPCLGPIGEVTIVPAAAWAWQAFVIEEMWNYDSMFIWIYESEANVDWAYDAMLPFDGHLSGDGGATWSDMAIRPFIRAVLTGETPGDVPVSGIINTIKIPSTAAQLAEGPSVSVPSNVQTFLSDFDGAGTLLEAILWVLDDDLALPTNPWLGVRYEMRIYADGALAFQADNRELTQSSIATFGRSSCGEFLLELAPDVGASWMQMSLRIPVEFRRNLAIYFFHRAGANLSTDSLFYANVLR